MRFLIAGVAGLVVALASTHAEELPGQHVSPFQRLQIDELAWLAPDADARRFLTEVPRECLAAENDPHKDQLIELGRVAFRSPLLLGGQAARNGLSCNNCHRNGHDNPVFFLQGLSGEPGTADVTHSLFSKSREDGVLNPVPIPTLLDAGSKEIFGTVAPAPNLEAFIEGAIIEEFQGAPPGDLILSAIAEYVRRLNADACPGGAFSASNAALNLDAAVDDLTRALAAALRAIDNEQTDAADFLIVSAQRIAGDIHDRYGAPTLAPERKALAAFAADLAGARAMIAEDPAGAKRRLTRSADKIEKLATFLRAAQDQSLYDGQAIDAALELRH